MFVYIFFIQLDAIPINSADSKFARLSNNKNPYAHVSKLFSAPVY